jgi:TP901 family phage tail tape measure protein
MSMTAEVDRLIVQILGDARSYETMISQVERRTARASDKLVSLGTRMSLALTVPLTVVGTVAVREFAKFDDAMTKSLAIMGDVSAQMRNEMAATARSIGRSSTTSSDKVAEAYYFLASAGMDAASAMKALPIVEKFATAGAFDMAQATEMLADAQSALGLAFVDPIKRAKEMTRVSDVMVEAANMSNASQAQFAKSLTTKSAAALRSFNKTVEEGVAVLAVYADQGIKGEMAGEKLSIMLRSLSDAVIKEPAAWKAFNLELYDSSGKLKHLTDIVRMLEGATAGLSDEQKILKFHTLGLRSESLSAITPLLGMSEKIATYEKRLLSAGGATEKVAREQLKSFSNQMIILTNQVKDAAITVGGLLAPMITDLGVSLGGLIEQFQHLPAPMQKTIVMLGVGAAAAGPLIIGMGMVVNYAGILTASFLKLGRVVPFTLGLMGTVGSLGMKAVEASIIQVIYRTQMMPDYFRAASKSFTGMVALGRTGWAAMHRAALVASDGIVAGLRLTERNAKGQIIAVSMLSQAWTKGFTAMKVSTTAMLNPMAAVRGGLAMLKASYAATKAAVLSFSITQAASTVGTMLLAGVTTAASAAMGLFMTVLSLGPAALVAIAVGIALVVAGFDSFMAGIKGAAGDSNNLWDGMKQDALIAFDGISAALKSGNITDALSVVADALKVIWVRVLNELEQMWRGFTDDAFVKAMKVKTLGVETDEIKALRKDLGDERASLSSMRNVQIKGLEDKLRSTVGAAMSKAGVDPGGFKGIQNILPEANAPAPNAFDEFGAPRPGFDQFGKAIPKLVRGTEGPMAPAMPSIIGGRLPGGWLGPQQAQAAATPGMPAEEAVVSMADNFEKTMAAMEEKAAAMSQEDKWAKQLNDAQAKKDWMASLGLGTQGLSQEEKWLQQYETGLAKKDFLSGLGVDGGGDGTGNKDFGVGVASRTSTEAYDTIIKAMMGGGVDELQLDEAEKQTGFLETIAANIQPVTPYTDIGEVGMGMGYGSIPGEDTLMSENVIMPTRDPYADVVDRWEAELGSSGSDTATMEAAPSGTTTVPTAISSDPLDGPSGETLAALLTETKVQTSHLRSMETILRNEETLNL